MIEYYKTSCEVAADGTKVPSTDRVGAPVRGCWISVVAPTQEERRWMLEELHVNPEFVTYALDDEETSRVDLDAETGQALVIVDCPFVEDEREAVERSIWAQQDAQQDGTNDYVSFRLVKKDGTYRSVLDHGRLIHNRHYGDIFYVLFMDSDFIRERYQKQ